MKIDVIHQRCPTESYSLALSLGPTFTLLKRIPTDSQSEHHLYLLYSQLAFRRP